MSLTDAREQASRLRLGLSAVAVLQPFFWFCRRGVDPTEVDVQGLRLMVVIGAVTVIVADQDLQRMAFVGAFNRRVNILNAR